MLKPFCKFFSFFNLIVFGVLLPLSATAGNLKDVRDQSVEEFAQEKGFQEILELEAKGEIYCGTKEYKCKRKTQSCWRCITDWEEGWPITLSKQHHESGRCFDISDRSGPDNWCPHEHFNVGVVERTQRIKYEQNGFLADNNASLLLWEVYSNEEDRTFADSKGNLFMLIYDGEDASFAYAGRSKEEVDAGKNISKGCEVLPVKIYNMSKCFFCPLAAVVFESANDIAHLSFTTFKRPFAILITVAFAIWLAFNSLQLVFTYTKQEGNKFLSNIIKQGGKFLIAYLMLSYPEDLFAMFIAPILEAGLNMGTAIQQTNVSARSYTPSIISSVGYFNTGGLYSKVEKFLADVQAQLSAVQAIGSTLFCVGGHQMVIGSFKEVFQLKDMIRHGIQMLALGFILFLLAILLSIAFAFYFLDALIQLAVLGAMLPMMIAGWPFKVTATYSTTGLKMLLNTFFSMFFTGFVISVEICLIDSALEEINKTKIDGATTSSGTGLGGLFNAINNQHGDDIRRLTDIGGAGFLLLAFASVFGFKFVSQVPKLADKLSAGANMGVASRVGTMGASAAKGAASKVTSPFRDMARESWAAKGGVMGMAGRALQAPHRLAQKTKLGRAVSNRMQTARENISSAFGEARAQGNLVPGKTKLGRFINKVHNSKALTTLRETVNGLKVKLSNSKLGHSALGEYAKQRIDEHREKRAIRRENIREFGILGAAGKRMEAFGKKVHKEALDAEKEGEQVARAQAAAEARGEKFDAKKYRQYLRGNDGDED